MITVERRLREWVMWKVWLPFVFILAMWPVGCAMHRDEAYQQAFAHGEFLIFGAMVMLEVALELKHATANGGDDFWPEAAWFAAIVIVFSYGFVRILVWRIEETPKFQGDLLYYACFSCSVALAAVSVGVFAYWRAKGAAVARQLPGS